jgi:hypothetical protein
MPRTLLAPALMSCAKEPAQAEEAAERPSRSPFLGGEGGLPERFMAAVNRSMIAPLLRSEAMELGGRKKLLPPPSDRLAALLARLLGELLVQLRQGLVAFSRVLVGSH